MSNVCRICGAVPECFVKSYHSKHYIDGKHHDILCLLCASIPNTYEYDEERGIRCYKHKSPFYLNTAEYLFSEGWKPNEIQASLKAVRKRIEGLINIEPIQSAVLEALFLSDEVEVVFADNGSVELKYH